MKRILEWFAFMDATTTGPLTISQHWHLALVQKPSKRVRCQVLADSGHFSNFGVPDPLVEFRDPVVQLFYVTMHAHVTATHQHVRLS